MDGGLVSREAELRLVVDELTTGRKGGVALRGPAGCGKSRLAEECMQQAAAAGCSVASARASETARNVPFGALAGLVPALGAEANPLAAATGPMLAMRRPGTRMVLFVDDAQWLDETSAALVRHLVNQHDVFALLTACRGERSGDAAHSLLRDRAIRTVDLAPMTDDDIVAIAEALLAGPLDANLAAELAALAAGSPLIGVELVHGGREVGLLQRTGRAWTAVGDLGRAPAVRELMAGRVDRLDEDDRHVVELVAHGEPLALDAFGPTDLDRLVRLEERAIVAIRSTAVRQEVWLAHPLFGETIRGATSASRRRLLLHELVGRVAALGNEVDRLRVAVWSLESGTELPADHLGAAATRAFATHRFDLAARVIAAVPPSARSDRQAYQLVVASWWVGDRAAYETAIGDARARAAAHDAGELAARLDEFEATAVPLMGTPPIELAHVIPEDFRLDPADDLPATRGPAGLGFALTHTGRPLDALAHVEAALEQQLAVWDTDPMSIAPTHPVAALLATVLARLIAGDIAGAHQMAERSAEFDFGADIAVLDAHGALARGLVAHRSGRLRRAYQQFDHAASRYDRSLHRDGPFAVFAHSLAALTAAMRRDLASARRHLPPERAAASLLGGMAGVAAGWVAAAERDTATAVQHFAGALGRNLDSGYRYFAVEAACGLARVGSADLAVASLDELADVQGPLLTALRDEVAATAIRDADRLGRISHDFERIGALADAAETAAEHVRCLAHLRFDREATAAAVRLRQLLSRCEGLDTPGVVVPVTPVALTDREREIALLAAERVPAREIGERLFISPRTVTNHLQRVYEKLGVSSRSELRDALGVGVAH